jgi:hypothetical protein
VRGVVTVQESYPKAAPTGGYMHGCHWLVDDVLWSACEPRARTALPVIKVIRDGSAGWKLAGIETRVGMVDRWGTTPLLPARQQAARCLRDGRPDLAEGIAWRWPLAQRHHHAAAWASVVSATLLPALIKAAMAG